MKKKGKKSYQVYEYNPSLMSMSDIEYSNVSKGAKVKELDTEDENKKVVVIENVIVDGKYQIKDSATFFKIFKNLDLRKLSKPSVLILDYIIKNLHPKKDVIQIHPRDCIKHCLWNDDSRAMFYRGISGLLDNHILFIKTGAENEYFINVNLIFNGSRTGIYEKNIIKASEEHKAKLLEANAIMRSIEEQNEEQDENNN